MTAAFVPTPEQQAAIVHPPTPLLIVAGAGTGKTSVMAERIIHLLSGGTYREDQILGLTFTNKAAGALKARLAERRPGGTDVTVATYHSFGASLVADHAVELDLHPRTRLLTRTQAWQLLFGVFDDFRFERRKVLLPYLVVDDGLLLAGRCADHLVALDTLVRDCAEVARGAKWQKTRDAATGRGELCQIVAAYDERKRERHLIDYGDQIRLAVQLLTQHPEVAREVRDQYPVALLDEYQDTNYAQRVLLQAIYPPGSPITAVGDDMQSIYAFRGAHRDNILHFTDHFSPVNGAPVIRTTLTVNRRSGARLVALANAIQAQVGDALDKDLRALDGAPDTAINCFLAADDAEEAAVIAGQIAALGPPWSAHAVLCRKRRQLIPVAVQALEAARVPVTVVGSSGLLDRPEVVDLASWLEVLAGDAPVALLRLLRGPRYRLGWRDLATLARQGGLSAAAADAPGLSAEATSRLERFAGEHRALAEVAGRVPVVELAEAVIDQTGLWSAAGVKGRENLLRFLDLAEGFAPVEGDPGLPAFVEYLRLLDESDEDIAEATATGEDAVTVMTIHQAKGLEFPNVWVPGLAGRGSSTIFPDGRGAENPFSQTPALPWWVRPEPPALPTWQTAASLDQVTQILRAHSLEEEWRLFYVACTRAQRRLTLSAAHWYPGPAAPQGPSAFYEFVAGRPDLVTELFRHEPVTVDPAESAKERLRAARRTGAVAAGAYAGPGPGPVAADGVAADGVAVALTLFGPDEGRAVPSDAAGVGSVRRDRAVPSSLSVTSLVSYDRCPRQFYWSVVRPLPRRPSPAASLGTEIHRCIELKGRRQLSLLEPAPADDAAPGTGDGSPVDPGRPSGADPVAGYLACFEASPLGPLDPERVEAPFAIALGGRLVRGRVDAVYHRDGRVELVDFKTGRSPAPGDQGAGTQLELYAVAAVRAWRMDPSSLRTTYCYLDPSEPARLISTDWDATGVERITARLDAALAGLDAERFRTRPGPWCRGCPYVDLCPDGQSPGRPHP